MTWRRGTYSVWDRGCNPPTVLSFCRSTCVLVHTRFEDVFKSIVYNQNLMSLSLDCVPHSLEMVSLLGEALENPVHSICSTWGELFPVGCSLCAGGGWLDVAGHRYPLDRSCLSFSRSAVSSSLQPHGLYPPGASVHGILQARILEWAAIPSSRGSSQPRDQIQVSCIGRWMLYHLSHQERPRFR